MVLSRITGPAHRMGRGEILPGTKQGYFGAYIRRTSVDNIGTYGR